jgi:NAD(P)-dependent dehydrogenase (short-subunit alcohol dehydrogenase family)
VESAYQALRRAREIRENLRRIRDTGVEVRYAGADVRDPEALARVLGQWRTEFGPPVGLVHAAGVIQDKFLRDKTTPSFDRVLSTKLQGALNLAHQLDPKSLRFSALFSSVAGRFGNRGQADYAAANEALNKLAVWLDARWPGRVVSIMWGPWSGVGMVSDLEKHLGSRGLTMIPPEDGRSRLLDELLRGRKGEVEVVIAGNVGSLEHPHAPGSEDRP